MHIISFSSNDVLKVFLKKKLKKKFEKKIRKNFSKPNSKNIFEKKNPKMIFFFDYPSLSSSAGKISSAETGSETGSSKSSSLSLTKKIFYAHDLDDLWHLRSSLTDPNRGIHSDAVGFRVDYYSFQFMM